MKANRVTSKGILYEEVKKVLGGRYKLNNYNESAVKKGTFYPYRANTKTPLQIASNENTPFEKAMEALQTHVIIEYLTSGELYDPIWTYAEKSSLILKNAEKKLSVPAGDTLSKYGLTSASLLQARKKQEA